MLTGFTSRSRTVEIPEFSLTHKMWLIISSFINNVPSATCVLHQTPQHWFLLDYLLGRKTARQLGAQLLGSLSSVLTKIEKFVGYISSFLGPSLYFFLTNIMLYNEG